MDDTTIAAALLHDAVEDTEITVAEQRCRIEFDVSAADGSNRGLVLRRGDEQRNWVLGTP